MKTITLEELLEAGCHFGHQVTRHNPKARDYIFEARDNVHIIDLAKTKEGLDEAAEYVKNLAKSGGSMIILGAKRQAEPVIKEQAEKVKKENVDGLFFVTNRWIGGTLTNFDEVSKNFQKLKDLTKFMETPTERARFTKKEVALMERERQKLMNFYWSLQDMKKTPDAVFIIDTHLENLAVLEAKAMNVTRIGITDTNANPDLIDYPIPANDDAVGSIQLIVGHIVDAWIEGADEHKRGARLQAEGADKGGTEKVKKTASNAASAEEAQKAEEKPETKKELTEKDKEGKKMVDRARTVDTKGKKENTIEKAVKRTPVAKVNKTEPKTTVKTEKKV